MKIIDTINKEYFKQICKESNTMAEAAMKLNLHYNTFIRIAKKLNCYKPNQGAKGCSKKHKITALDSLLLAISGNYPTYQTNKLRLSILKYNIKPHKCEICGLEIWNNQTIPLELHHKDGNRYNHLLENLILICPNCHAQTKTYRGKNSQKNNGGSEGSRTLKPCGETF